VGEDFGFLNSIFCKMHSATVASWVKERSPRYQITAMTSVSYQTAPGLGNLLAYFVILLLF
jgi:hypothetical protein